MTSPISINRKTKTLLIWWLLTLDFSRAQFWAFGHRIMLDCPRKLLWIGDLVLILKTFEEYHRDRTALEWGNVAFQATFLVEPKRNFGTVEVQQELTARRNAFFAWHRQVLGGRLGKK